MKNRELLIGCDPELFVLNKNGTLLSGHGMIPGTKWAPHPVEYGAVQVDGMALEFNIHPAKTESEFVGNINVVMDCLRRLIPEGHKFAIEPVAIFGKKTFNDTPEEARELGCNPDYNAYTEEINEPPTAPEKEPTMRTASGHVHIGWTEDMDPFDPQHFKDCCAIVKQLDYYLGIPSLLWDSDDRRRKMYGQAGAFRPKSYGCEYRVLSNAWLKKEALTRFVYRATRRAVEDLLTGEVNMWNDWGTCAQYIINDNDTNWPDWFDWDEYITGLKLEDLVA